MYLILTEMYVSKKTNKQNKLKRCRTEMEFFKAIEVKGGQAHF